jgi:hypothetical protein
MSCVNHKEGKGKIKSTLAQAMKAEKRSRGMAIV